MSLCAPLPSPTQELDALQEEFNRLGGDVLTQLESDKAGLESEKNALLDYVTESLDNVASLESEKATLQTEVARLTPFELQCEELKHEAAAFDVKMRDSSKDLDKCRNDLSVMEKKREEQQFEIDEMAAMQVELLEQLKNSSAEVDTKTRSISEQQAEIEVRAKQPGDKKLRRHNIIGVSWCILYFLYFNLRPNQYNATSYEATI
jgi:uncharacterized coiled-coil DUF342 family protein